MKYTDQLANQVIAKYGLGRSVKHNRKKAQVIPDYYFDSHYVKPKPLTKKQQIRQEMILLIINDPLIKHAAFNEDTVFVGKLDEVLTLRRGRLTQPAAVRIDRIYRC